MPTTKAMENEAKVVGEGKVKGNNKKKKRKKNKKKEWTLQKRPENDDDDDDDDNDDDDDHHQHPSHGVRVASGGARATGTGRKVYNCCQN